ncbi:helix-turn-helix domain-containing protein [Amycolatopsis cynarae]|uniref:Helix-turn-helix domain-containing protein n=1 Tax=Amycolatopsis cynarae TaxID=2995223 RepID=A0ABY7BAQ0_9PSEU|nr:helix-turn-helix domain-containing protein [Amycolatopsis sp. HUAS 11-8]WAL69231.1 helix-turn-helix domain-containing protein [Amycolatopsis sp. HUAS 11-8]
MDAWRRVVDLIERVVGEEDLLAVSVAGVRTLVPEVAVLTPADIAGHTRALLAAAARALAARRGPTGAELSFVEDLAVTRAHQGVPIEAVLRAIHVAERAIWSRAREAAAADGVGPELLLDARELYDDWAEAVRGRLIAAHRAANADQAPARDRDVALLRRLLDGGSAAALAAAEAGLPVTGGLWVAVARPGGAAAVRRALAERHRPSPSAVVDGLLVAVLGQAPSPRSVPDGTLVGLAGPAEPEELTGTRRLALAALTAAEATARAGLVHIAEVPVLAAIVDRADLAAALLEKHRQAWATLGANAEPVARAVCAWVEAGGDTNRAAERQFVHPNTVRNRVLRFAGITGIDPGTAFGAVDAWWLCRAWLARP